jgi:hypothetical protein
VAHKKWHTGSAWRKRTQHNKIELQWLSAGFSPVEASQYPTANPAHTNNKCKQRVEISHFVCLAKVNAPKVKLTTEFDLPLQKPAGITLQKRTMLAFVVFSHLSPPLNTSLSL